MYITVTVAVVRIGIVLPYCRASLILVNYRPLDGGGWFSPLGNTGVIKPSVSQRRACDVLATSTLRGFLVSFKFFQKITALDYRRGAPPSAHRPPWWAQ